MKYLVTFDLEFDLKFEISDGKNLVKFGGRASLPAREARNIRRHSGRISGANFRENFGNFVSYFATFFGNFIQQKGGLGCQNHRTISGQNFLL